MSYTVKRFEDNPIIHSGMDESIGTNINGPSLIRVPDWLPHPMGKYYLYFAHHGGGFIRLAYADDVRGPWKIHTPGTLHLEQTCCRGHIASPDVHLDHANRRVVMYFHGPVAGQAAQCSFVAFSNDGLDFVADREILGPPYFRVFQHEGAHYAISMARGEVGPVGMLMRSEDGRAPFEPGPTFLDRQRHVAVRQREGAIDLFFSRGMDCPERLMTATMALEGDWRGWRPSNPEDLLPPELAYEGADRPLEPSSFGPIHEPVRQLRDPGIFEEDGRTWLLYACAGESGIALAELTPASAPAEAADPAASSPTDDLLASTYRGVIRPALATTVRQYEKGRRYVDDAFPMDEQAFASFRQDVVTTYARSLGLEAWAVRSPADRTSPLAERFRFRSLRTTARHGVTMEIGLIDIHETGDSVPVVLCLPQTQDPAPGIGVFSGHSRHGLRDLTLDLDSYQAGVATRLAQAGFVTIAVEKVDAGLLARAMGDGNDEPVIGTIRLGWGRPTRAHQIMTCIAAIEILAQHPRVDPLRIGTTGVSLGGWLSVETALLSDRVQAVADFGMKTRHVDPAQPLADLQGIRDICHIYPGMLSLCDRNLIPLAWCPCPMLAGHGNQDQRSDARGASDYRDLYQTQYEKLGCGDRYEYLIHGAGDDMPAPEVVDYFQRVFG